MSRNAFAVQTDLEPRMLDLLTLFDAFEHDGEPYSFRDTIIGRKYQRLLASRRELGRDRPLGPPLGQCDLADGAVARSPRARAS